MINAFYLFYLLGLSKSGVILDLKGREHYHPTPSNYLRFCLQNKQYHNIFSNLKIESSSS